MPRAAAALVLLLAACRAAGGPGSSAPAPSSAGVPTSASQPSTASTATAWPASQPGTPYSAADLLDAMRASRRPGGVPDQLETEEIASAIAAQAWTWDGEPWETITVGAACGPDGCSLDLSGAPPGEDGTDLYSFTVDPASGEVQLRDTDLHGHPSAVQELLDATARTAIGADRLEGMALVGSRWLPPPEAGRYWLAYRSGGEEGSPGLDVLLDAGSGEVLEALETG
jgi:hypothetical protein